ncbi:MAG TPA: PIN domain-containing protein [Tepidisphaeraceae bacterium]|nr:PIN domain-containing protein [Tepidisphaeraceae bacterium]
MSQTVFVDTNVLLDVLLARQPFVDHAQRIWSMAERAEIRAVVSAASFLNVYYIVARLSSRAQADRAIRGMLAIFQIAPVDTQIINQAVESGSSDFEDAAQQACASRAGAVCIVTRDERHFGRSTVPAIGPDAFLAKIDSGQ